MDIVRAVVQDVRNGRHGPFVVATASGFKGSITFSLQSSVWQERQQPEQGSIVLLSDLQLKRAGWRAMCGRFVRPSDQNQHQALSKEI